ncbi:neutral zinc metallopeptidase [Rhodococcus sp. ARC_M6]|uniref:neutral zinc metallopeptidase n=1 Tax=Rhodococcus sp. ARC_M6 TaxID=2928852 RepID=UPI001FB3EE98|nr:neutral zinc metallopeptidase [Rhodococcus sp. ARC_M6]MCJ0903130.1 neutral zinc metallopeptidase [Rhodococcus sp. ARC_M6]
MVGRRAAIVTSSLMATAALLVSCSQGSTGHAVSIYHDPFRVAGLDASSGPSGLRPGAPDAQRDIVGTDGGPIDALAANAITDIETFWKTQYPALFNEPFQPVDTLISWDPTEPGGPEFCEESTKDLINAGYCSLDHTIGWDRELLLPEVQEKFGDVAVAFIFAHEYGHAIQRKAGIVEGGSEAALVREQQADCFGGAFLRHVAEDKAIHFTMNTSDGLNKVLASAVAIRDDDPNDPDSHHGSAFERVTATQIGFTDGPGACAKMDDAEIESRRADLPQQFSEQSESGELPVTESTLQEFLKTFQSIFELQNPPTVTFDGADTGCTDATTTEPVSFCPATNTIGISVDELAERGTPGRVGRRELMPTTITGDYNAYVLLASRYTLAMQKERGQTLDTPQTALRAACLSGVITAALSPTNAATSGAQVTLSPGDLDEAVSGLLTDGLAASDVNGDTVPSGFARVDAFRTGVLGGQVACDSRYTE